MWDQVDDFNWLRAEHSPNWSVLQPGDEVTVRSRLCALIEAFSSRGYIASELDDSLRAAMVL